MIVLLIPMTTVFASLGDNIVTYEITLENLTDGQIFSPPIFITHQQRYKLFNRRPPGIRFYRGFHSEPEIPSVALAKLALVGWTELSAVE